MRTSANAELRGDAVARGPHKYIDGIGRGVFGTVLRIAGAAAG